MIYTQQGVIMNSNASHVSFWSKINPVHAALAACSPLMFACVEWFVLAR